MVRASRQHLTGYFMKLLQLRNGFTLFRQALVGSVHINYTEGSIVRATFLLAVPMIVEMLMEALFAIVDIFFVAGLGASAVATVGLTEAVISLVYAISIGLSMAATALIARRIGEGNVASAAQVAGQVMWVGVLVSLVIAVTGWFYAEQILRLMGASDEVVAIGTTYTGLMFAGSFSIVFLFLNNAVFRGAGDATIAMRALILANGINIVLDPILIYGLGPVPGMGLTGAAVASIIGRSCGVVYQLCYLVSRNRRIRIAMSDLRLRFRIICDLLRVSAGGMAQYLISTASWIFLTRLVAQHSAEAVAGYTIAVRVIMVVILPVWGMSNAVATLVGQNLGAGRVERAERTVWLVVGYNLAYMALVALLLMLYPGWILSFFTDAPEVISNGIQSLRILSYGFVFMAIGSVVVQACNGAGDTFTPMWINIVAFWVVQIPLAWTLTTAAQWGPEGVYWSVFVADVIMSLMGLAVFLRGRWKRFSC